MLRPIALIMMLCFLQNAASQMFYVDTIRTRKGLAMLGNKYFGINPHNIPFDSLVSSIGNNPDFVTEVAIARSDTSRFYLRGHFKTYNPFEINFDTVKIVMAEQVTILPGTSIRDTLLLLQLFGNNLYPRYADAVRAEFRRIDKEARKYFTQRTYNKTKKEDPVAGESYQYYEGIGRRIFRLNWGIDDQRSGIVMTYFLSYRRVRPNQAK